jgi:hypothetical protein
VEVGWWAFIEQNRTNQWVKVKLCLVKKLLHAQQFLYGSNVNFEVNIVWRIAFYIKCYGDFYMMILENFYIFYA